MIVTSHFALIKDVTQYTVKIKSNVKQEKQERLILFQKLLSKDQKLQWMKVSDLFLIILVVYSCTVQWNQL